MANLTHKKRGSKKKSPEITRLVSLFKALNLKPADIAKATDISERTITNFIWEDTPIGGQLLRKLHVIYRVSLDWLLSGEGDMFCRAKSVSDIAADYVVIDARKLRIHSFVDEFMTSASEDEKAWFEMQLKFNVPPYRAFVEKDNE